MGLRFHILVAIVLVTSCGGAVPPEGSESEPDAVRRDDAGKDPAEDVATEAPGPPDAAADQGLPDLRTVDERGPETAAADGAADQVAERGVPDAPAEGACTLKGVATLI